MDVQTTAKPGVSPFEVPLKFSLKTFSRRGATHPEKEVKIGDDEGLVLLIECLEANFRKNVLVNFDIHVSLADVSKRPTTVQKWCRVLLLGQGFKEHSSLKSVSEKIAVLSYWNGSYSCMFGSSDIAFHKLVFPGAIFLSLTIHVTPVLLGDSDSNCSTASHCATSSTLSNEFKAIYLKEDNFHDIKLKSKDNILLSAHKFVLSARSPYFHDILKTQEGGSIKVISVDIAGAKPLMAILHWMYCNEIPDNAGLFLSEILEAAKHFNLRALPKSLEYHMVKMLNDDNMLEFATLAKQHGMKEALEEIKVYMIKNLAALTVDNEHGN